MLTTVFTAACVYAGLRIGDAVGDIAGKKVHELYDTYKDRKKEKEN